MHGGSHRHLDSFQVQPACSAEVLKDHPEQRAYFAFDFLPDRFRRFFSCRDKVSSTGRTAQSCSLTTTTCSQKS
jgi:hypothetical protein